MKKYRLWLLLGISVLAMIIFIKPFILKSIADTTWDQAVVYVNGYPISYREYVQELSHHKANVYSYFHEHYKVIDGPDFWTSSYGGEIPIDMAKERALNKAVERKIIQILAYDEGLIEDISYSAFLESLRLENDRRRQYVEENKIIYGPKQYDERLYYLYQQSNMLIDLKELLKNNTFKPTEDELRFLYENLREDRYKELDEMKIERVSIVDNQSKGSLNSEVEETAKAIHRVIQDDVGFQVAIKPYIYEKDITVTQDDIVLNQHTIRHTYDSMPLQFERILSLQVGEVSEIIREKGALHIIRVVGKKKGDYTSYEEVKEDLIAMYVNKRWEVMLQEMIDKAEVIVEADKL